MFACWLAGISSFAPVAFAQPFHLPTANRGLLEPGGQEKFFVGTAGKSWQTGMFGCVRSEGAQFHEGLDIRCLERDKKGEPVDPVMATADGVVAYINSRPELSTFGKYIVLRHQLEGLEIYSLYAHLREIRAGLKPGQNVRTGEPIAILGRTANTRQQITKDRAHVHFELDLLVNDRFAAWYKKFQPGERNDHGCWNGQNLIGFDPARLLKAPQGLAGTFSLLQHLRQQPELCRVLVRVPNFPFARRYAPLVQPNPTAAKEGIAGYELALTFNGLPFQLTPRAPSEIKSRRKFQLLSVNAAEYQQHPCGHLVVKKKGNWELTTRGQNLLDLLTY